MDDADTASARIRAQLLLVWALSRTAETRCRFVGSRNRRAGNDHRCADIATHGRSSAVRNLLRMNVAKSLLRFHKREAANENQPLATASGEAPALLPDRCGTIAFRAPDTTSLTGTVTLGKATRRKTHAREPTVIRCFPAKMKRIARQGEIVDSAALGLLSKAAVLLPFESLEGGTGWFSGSTARPALENRARLAADRDQFQKQGRRWASRPRSIAPSTSAREDRHIGLALRIIDGSASP